MKLLITQETDWIQRNPAQQHHLAEMLSLRGHEIRVIDYELLWRMHGSREVYSPRRVFYHVTKIHRKADVTLIRPAIIKIPVLDYLSLIVSHEREIARQIAAFSPDAIVGFGILNSYLGTRAGSKHRIPFIYYWIDVLHRLIPLRPFRPLGKMVESYTLKKADRVLVINEKLRDYVTKLGAPPERAMVLPAGIDFTRFNPAEDGSAVRQRYKLKADDIVLLFMGWLYRFSGVKEVALSLAQADHPTLKLLVVGEGDAYEELQQMRHRLGLQERIILTGKQPYQEIPSFVAASDVCLLPAYPNEKIMQDIVPIKIYEYMAMKKPVIATRLPGILREFGEDNGVVYVDKPEQAVTKALELIQGGRSEELGQRARSFVERYSWEKITDEFERILEETIKERHG